MLAVTKDWTVMTDSLITSAECRIIKLPGMRKLSRNIRQEQIQNMILQVLPAPGSLTFLIVMSRNIRIEQKTIFRHCQTQDHSTFLDVFLHVGMMSRT